MNPRDKKPKLYTYILVTTGDGDIPIIPLRTHNSLNTIRDQIPRLQAVTHPSGPHRNRIAHPDRIKPKPNHSTLPHPLFHGLGQAQQVHVARVAFVPDGGNPYLGLSHVLIGEAHAVQDGLGPALGLGFGDLGAVFVEFLGRGGGGGGDGEGAAGGGRWEEGFAFGGEGGEVGGD